MNKKIKTSKKGATGEPTILDVIIETPKGSRNKFKYDSTSRMFKLSKVLPEGMSFPYDFGFVPSTVGDDGDPLDVLVLMDEPTSPGCLVRCRLIGVIEGEQSEKGGKPERNDRLLAVALESQEHQDIKKLKDLEERENGEIEEFFVNYHRKTGSQFRPLSRKGPNAAERLVKKGSRRGGRRARPWRRL